MFSLLCIKYAKFLVSVRSYPNCTLATAVQFVKNEIFWNWLVMSIFSDVKIKSIDRKFLNNRIKNNT